MTTTPRPTLSPADVRTAYRKAQQQYDADPLNPQHRRALGWSLTQLLREASEQGAVSRMIRGLAVLDSLATDANGQRWNEPAVDQATLWAICRFLLRTNVKQLPLGELAGLVAGARAFVEAGPSLVRSVWWKALLHHTPTGIDWLGLFDTLGWEEGFRPDDFLPETYGDRTTPALVERLLQAVMKQLLATIPLADALAAPWIERVSSLSEQQPGWGFLPYYHARLLVVLDRTDEARRVFLPFARTKQREFWVWTLMADLTESAEGQLACLTRALTVGAPEAFLVKVRQQVAGRLLLRGCWADARAELDRLVQTRQANQWPIPALVQSWLNDARYTSAEPSALGHWYGAMLPVADALLWADCPETVALVTGLDPTGQYVQVAIDSRTTGSFPARKFGLHPVVGDGLTLRYQLDTRKGKPHLRVLTASPTDAVPTVATRLLSGPLRLLTKPTGSVGFVGDVYVPADLLAQHTGLADALVTVRAVESWDGGKKKVGWRAYALAKSA